MNDRFSRETERKGEEYFERGRVKNAFVLDGKLHSSVIGTHEYRVSVNLSDGQNSCTCPMGGACKHVAATRIFHERRAVPDAGRIIEGMSGEAISAFVHFILHKHPSMLKLLTSYAKKQGKSKMTEKEVFEELVENWGDPDYVSELYADSLLPLKGKNEALSMLCEQIIAYDKKKPVEDAFERWLEDFYEDIGGDSDYYDLENIESGISLTDLTLPIYENMDFRKMGYAQVKAILEREKGQFVDFSVEKQIFGMKREDAERLLREFYDIGAMLRFCVSIGDFENAKLILMKEAADLKISKEDVKKIYGHFGSGALDFIGAENMDTLACILLEANDMASFSMAFGIMKGQGGKCSFELLEKIITAEKADKKIRCSAADEYVSNLYFMGGHHELDYNVLCPAIKLAPRCAERLVANAEQLIRHEASSRNPDYKKVLELLHSMKDAGVKDDMNKIVEFIITRHRPKRNLMMALSQDGFCEYGKR